MWVIQLPENATGNNQYSTMSECERVLSFPKIGEFEVEAKSISGAPDGFCWPVLLVEMAFRCDTGVYETLCCTHMRALWGYASTRPGAMNMLYVPFECNCPSSKSPEFETNSTDHIGIDCVYGC